MNIAHFFIDRPVFAAVLSIVTIIGGTLAALALPIAQYPEIAPPTVTVSTTYPGANAETVAKTVATPIEEQVNGVENMLYMSSQCTNDGGMHLTVTFKVGTNLDTAQVQVQNRLAPRRQTAGDQVRIAISGQQHDLKKQHARGPHGRTAAEPRKNEFANQRLHLKEQKGA